VRVFTAAIMDLCHAGHLNLLRRMGAAGDSVTVVLHDDAACYRIKGKFPIQSIDQRARNVLSTGLVDEVLVTELTDPSDQWLRLIDREPTDQLHFMRGDDNLDPPGKWLLDHFKITQEYIPYTEGISSSEVRTWLS